MSMRRGFILPVVLVVIGMLAVAMAGLLFFVRAELAGARAHRDAQQARLAAESGLQEVITVLRVSRDDPNAWFDVPDRFRHALVWSEGYLRAEDPIRKGTTRRDLLERGAVVPAWRFSVVARNLDGLPDTMRYGITPEAGKLNLNAASETEIETLLLDVLGELQVENATEYVACLLDWLDADEDIRPGGAETEYYRTLTPAYTAKNGPLDTLDELLLVRHFTAAALYGEDTNRNGILDENEDDGAASFPFYDNADGILCPGLAPYVTLWSREYVAAAGDPNQPGGGDPNQPGGDGTGEGEGEDAGEGEGTPEGDGAKDPQAQQNRQPTGEQPGGGAFPGGAADDGSGGQLLGGQPAGGLLTGGQKLAKINVNTAPIRVLQALDGMTPEAAAQIVAARAELDAESLQDPQWVQQTLGGEAAALAGRLTTKCLQFHVEVVGYADHLRLTRRYEWIVDVRGPVVQVLYHRDLTGLGQAWPVDDETVVVRR